MAIIFTFGFVALVAIYFGIIRLLDSKRKEFLQFLVMYLFALSLIICLDCTFAKKTPVGLSGGGSMIIGLFVHIFNTVTGIEADVDSCWFSICYRVGVVAVYYLCPTFLVSYLLYPFKTVKKSRILIWIPVVISVLIPVIGILLLVLVAMFMN